MLPGWIEWVDIGIIASLVGIGIGTIRAIDCVEKTVEIPVKADVTVRLEVGSGLGIHDCYKNIKFNPPPRLVRVLTIGRFKIDARFRAAGKMAVQVLLHH